MTPLDPKLAKLLKRARERWLAMTPEEQEEELRAQQASWVRGEMGIGNDRAEAEYRASRHALSKPSAA